MVAVGLPLVGAPLALVDGCAGVVVPSVLAAAGLLMQLWLLVTTPVDAIKLRYSVSVIAIAAGTFWVQSFATARLWSDPEQAEAAGYASPVVLVLLLCFPVVTTRFRCVGLVAIRTPPSPWWMALPLWWPSVTYNAFGLTYVFGFLLALSMVARVISRVSPRLVLAATLGFVAIAAVLLGVALSCSEAAVN